MWKAEEDGGGELRKCMAAELDGGKINGSERRWLTAEMTAVAKMDDEERR